MITRDKKEKEQFHKISHDGVGEVVKMSYAIRADASKGFSTDG